MVETLSCINLDHHCGLFDGISLPKVGTTFVQIALDYQKICNPDKKKVEDARRDYANRTARLAALEMNAKVRAPPATFVPPTSHLIAPQCPCFQPTWWASTAAEAPQG